MRSLRLVQPAMAWLNIGFVILLCVSRLVCEEFTFELPDNQRQCFYEDLDVGTDVAMEFQVLRILEFTFYLSHPLHAFIMKR